MNSTWGVYEVRGRLTGGAETTATDRNATSYFVRWRVDGVKRRRTFSTKGQARQWRETLTTAKNLGWEADQRGWPSNPSATTAAVQVTRSAADGWTVETYIEQVWWPTISGNLNDKNRVGHRRNADLAVQLLRMRAGDPRTRQGAVMPGDSIPLEMWTADDTKAALAARRSINGRTAAKNRKTIESSMASAAAGPPTVADVVLVPEVAGAATIRHFKITLGMIAKAAAASGHLVGDPMADTASHAPKPRQPRMSKRLVPSFDELFDLADAISQLGPVMSDGRPRGARFRALILCAGTTGPRPGELAAHRPEWIDWDLDPSEIRFHKTEAAVYGAVLKPEERGRRERGLKHRDEDDFRPVPLIADVRAALIEHIERGYSSTERTWLSSTGYGHLDFHNLMGDYWRPAFARVFANTAKAPLVTASPKILRKTAITWWADSGINQALAAEWAGHTEEVARIYYASRASTTFAREVALLEPKREFA